MIIISALAFGVRHYRRSGYLYMLYKLNRWVSRKRITICLVHVNPAFQIVNPVSHTIPGFVSEAVSIKFCKNTERVYVGIPGLTLSNED